MATDEKHGSVGGTQYALDPEVEKTLPAPLADAMRRGSVPEAIMKHSHDADEAMKAFEGVRLSRVQTRTWNKR